MFKIIFCRVRGRAYRNGALVVVGPEPGHLPRSRPVVLVSARTRNVLVDRFRVPATRSALHVEPVGQLARV
jgi:hypothetical protein